jgi:hypothetical protein
MCPKRLELVFFTCDAFDARIASLRQLWTILDVTRVILYRYPRMFDRRPTLRAADFFGGSHCSHIRHEFLVLGVKAERHAFLCRLGLNMALHDRFWSSTNRGCNAWCPVSNSLSA